MHIRTGRTSWRLRRKDDTVDEGLEIARRIRSSCAAELM